MLSITPAAGFLPAIHANSDVTEVTVAFHSLLVVATTVQLVPPTGVEESKERNLIKFWHKFKNGTFLEIKIPSRICTKIHNSEIHKKR